MPDRAPQAARERAPSAGRASTWLGCAALAACAPPAAERALEWSRAEVATATPGDLHLPPPPLSDGIFPCTDCHDPEIPVNAQRRPMRAAHEEIVLDHDEEHRWCLDCHDAANRDQLHLAGGEPVSFEESHRLCGQCHAGEHRDWRAGVHGRRTGRWDGEKQYLLCVHCHDSHRPAFQPIAPMPAPRPPERAR